MCVYPNEHVNNEDKLYFSYLSWLIYVSQTLNVHPYYMIVIYDMIFV